jgi:hypothetical protein
MSRRRYVIYLAAGVVVVVAALVLRVHMERILGAGVHFHEQRELGAVAPRLGVQVFSLHAPGRGDNVYNDDISLSLEFSGEPAMQDDLPETEVREDLWKRPRVSGRYRVTVKNSEMTLVQSEGDLQMECNWHSPWQGAVVDLALGERRFDLSLPRGSYTVDFEWLDAPEQNTDVVLWYSYVGLVGG